MKSVLRFDSAAALTTSTRCLPATGPFPVSNLNSPLTSEAFAAGPFVGASGKKLIVPLTGPPDFDFTVPKTAIRAGPSRCPQPLARNRIPPAANQISKVPKAWRFVAVVNEVCVDRLRSELTNDLLSALGGKGLKRAEIDAVTDEFN